MPETQYPKNPNTDTAFVTDDQGKRTRAVKTVVLDGTIDYPKNSNSPDCYVTVDGKKQRALMTADISSEGTVEYPENSNSTKGYITVNGKKQRVVLTAALVGGGSPINNQDITVTSNGIYTADEGYTGLGTVDVNVPNPSTGTINITTNDTYDVTNYASAVVAVPTTAPDYYQEYIKVNGTLSKLASFPSLNGELEIAPFTFYYSFYNIGFPQNSSVDLSAVSVALESSFAYCFNWDLALDSNLTSIDLSGLQTTYTSSFSHFCYKNTSVATVDLSSLAQAGDTSFEYAFAGTSSVSCGLTSLSLPSLTNVGAGAFKYVCQYNTNLTTVNLPSISTLISTTTPQDYFYNAFANCSSLTNVTINNDLFSSGDTKYYNAFNYMFRSCTSLVNSPFTTVTKLNGSYTNPNSQASGRGNTFSYMFYGCTSLANTGLDNVTIISGLSACASMFNGCTSLTRTGLGKLEKIRHCETNETNYGTNTCYQMFRDCTALTDIELDSLKEAVMGSGSSTGTNVGGLANMFQGCTALTIAKFPELETVGHRAFSNTFNGCTSLANVYFYALNTTSFDTYTNQFNNMLKSVTGCTVHFPMRIQSTIGSWSDVTGGFGGTNTTVLFDIVTELTGADSNTYIRKEKESTGTATAWIYNDVIYYTSGTTEPAVSDTIYSDAACTTPVTTISAIA